jgi:iron complex transport system ATP-binding protein
VRDLEDLGRDGRPRAIVLVSHHLEEIPAGFDHALVLRDGRVVAAGPVADVLRDDVLTSAYGIPVQVEVRHGRWTARMRRPATR